MTTRQRIVIDGQLHDHLSIDDLEGFAFRNGMPITYPETTGWATTRLGSHRWAAWFDMSAPGTRMPEGSR